MNPIVIALSVDGSAPPAARFSGPACASCLGPNPVRYGANGGPLCVPCRPATSIRLAAAVPAASPALTDHEFWYLPIRWSDHHVQRRDHCEDCVAQLQATGGKGSLEQARLKRKAGNTTRLLCHPHAELWRTEQTRRAA